MPPDHSFLLTKVLSAIKAGEVLGCGPPKARGTSLREEGEVELRSQQHDSLFILCYSHLILSHYIRT
jgi:hypothetical protein